MTSQSNEAYLQGWDAYDDGYLLSDNPYDIHAFPISHRMWEQGLTDAFLADVDATS